jgi:hypothetical protein
VIDLGVNRQLADFYHRQYPEFTSLYLKIPLLDLDDFMCSNLKLEVNMKVWLAIRK